MMSRLYGLDLLRGIAAFGIVGCHLSLAPRTSGGNLATALCDFNVALFAAISGFLMCGARGHADWLAYVCRRAKRLLPPYFVWSAVFIVATAIFDLIFDGGCLNPRYRETSFWWRVVFLGGSSTQLWFLICLFYAQAILWPLFALYGGKRSGLAWCVVSGLLVCGSVTLPGWFGHYPLRLIAFLIQGFGIRCCLRGGLLDGFANRRFLVWMAAIGLLAAHILLSGILPYFIRDWLAVAPVLLAFAGMAVSGGRLFRIATFLGATSMGVFLVHPLVTRGFAFAVYRFVSSPYSAAVVLLEWVIAWCVSLAVSFALSRMPCVRRFV